MARHCDKKEQQPHARCLAQCEVLHQQKIFPSRQNGSVGVDVLRQSIRDTLMADYSAHGVNIMCRIPYRPLIGVSPVLLVLSVSDFQRALWHCGEQ